MNAIKQNKESYNVTPFRSRYNYSSLDYCSSDLYVHLPTKTMVTALFSMPTYKLARLNIIDSFMKL